MNGGPSGRGKETTRIALELLNLYVGEWTCWLVDGGVDGIVVLHVAVLIPLLLCQVCVPDRKALVWHRVGYRVCGIPTGMVQ